MPWFQLKIEHCPNESLEQVSQVLEALGALSIMLTDKSDNPVLEPEPGTTPLWPEVIIQALFAQAEEAQQAKNLLNQSNPTLQSSLEILPDQDWERAWMEDFKPARFGNRLWICPSWIKPPDPLAVNLLLDPGLAFGTGTHPTTALCLTWLEQASLQHKKIIDYGCGSGILSLAALKLGAQEVQAVDIDPQALQATQNNAANNQIHEEQLLIGPPENLKDPVDLIMANILLEPLISLKNRFHQLLKPQTELVVSGLLEEQIPLLIQAYDSLFLSNTVECMDGWALLCFTRT